MPAAQESGDETPDVLAGQLFVRGWRAALREPTATQAAHGHLAAWLDSSKLEDHQVLPLVAQVLRGYLGQADAAGLLVGSSGSSEAGRARRKRLLDQLISEVASPGSPSAVVLSAGDGTQ